MPLNNDFGVNKKQKERNCAIEAPNSEKKVSPKPGGPGARPKSTRSDNNRSQNGTGSENANMQNTEEDIR